MSADFMSLRQMQEDLKAAREDLEVCQCCETCLYRNKSHMREPCRSCRHANKDSKGSKWVWRRERRIEQQPKRRGGEDVGF